MVDIFKVFHKYVHSAPLLFLNYNGATKTKDPSCSCKAQNSRITKTDVHRCLQISIPTFSQGLGGHPSPAPWPVSRCSHRAYFSLSYTHTQTWFQMCYNFQHMVLMHSRACICVCVFACHVYLSHTCVCVRLLEGASGINVSCLDFCWLGVFHNLRQVWLTTLTTAQWCLQNR